MSSWVSHLPEEKSFAKVVGHGMNAAEAGACWPELPPLVLLCLPHEGGLGVCSRQHRTCALLHAQLARNQRLDSFFVRNLNAEPDGWALADRSFDAALICVSVQYLQQVGCLPCMSLVRDIRQCIAQHAVLLGAAAHHGRASLAAGFPLKVLQAREGMHALHLPHLPETASMPHRGSRQGGEPEKGILSAAAGAGLCGDLPCAEAGRRVHRDFQQPAIL